MFREPKCMEPVDYKEQFWQDAEAMRLGRGTCVYVTPPGLITKAKW